MDWSDYLFGVMTGSFGVLFPIFVLALTKATKR